MSETKLKFARGNAKLGKQTAIFSLPAGHTCAGALACLAMADRHTGKLTDGKQSQFRCYAASAEVLFTNTRISRWRNFDMLKGQLLLDMVKLIEFSLPRKATLCRIHQSGDFFSQTYFDAWLTVAFNNPNITFYAYTKMLPFWIARKNQMPKNFILTASRGGKFDALIERHNLKCVEVVHTVKEAKAKGLVIDDDDSNAWKHQRDFALLIHGVQKAGSVAGKAVASLRVEGKGGYASKYFASYKKN